MKNRCQQMFDMIYLDYRMICKDLNRRMCASADTFALRINQTLEKQTLKKLEIVQDGESGDVHVVCPMCKHDANIIISMPKRSLPYYCPFCGQKLQEDDEDEKYN